MLSVVPLRAGQQGYYRDAVARGLDEYYAGAGELPGRWMGRGSELLGLSGDLDGADLDAVLEGRDPSTGTRLTARVPKIVGYDATFCAPKSVSLLWALGDPEVAAEVRAAHDAAVAAALRALEDLACRVRRGRAGSQVVEADGFLAAGFVHRSSRAGDPHLHTHVLIAHPAHSDRDGRLSALDARQLFPWAKPVGHLYEAKLRAELSRRLGVRWGPVRNGIADLAGVPREVIMAFSQRRAEIEAHLEERGQSSARAAQLATYATRRPKGRDTAPESMLEQWRSRADELGITRDAVSGWGRHGPGVADHRPSTEELFATLAGPHGLTERRSTFDRRAAVRSIADAFGQGAEVDTVLDLVDRFLASDAAVALPVAPRTGHVLHRRDGSIAPLEVDMARFTTPELLAIERRLLRDAAARAQEHAAVVSTSMLRWAALDADHLSPEQRYLVGTITQRGRGVEVVVGAAGTGKTAALAIARRAWELERYRVLGCALAARAAAQLQAEAGIESATIDRLLASAARADGRLDADVLVVDEAGMVGTRQLARVLDLAAANRTKVVLVGDYRQLPEINAGGAFAALASDLDAVALHRNRRQREPWEREALEALRDGDPDRAVELYLAAGRVGVTDDADAAHQHMIRDWWHARAAGDEVVMLASRRAPVDALNRLARQQLRDHGLLGPDQLHAGGRDFAVGDTVIAGRNDYRRRVLNGTRGTVTRVDPKARSVTVDTDGGDTVEIPERYIAAGHLAHGYATTVHKAQGATVDTCLLLVDDQTYREAAYTGLSRGRLANRVYVVSSDPAALEAHGLRYEPADPMAVLQEAVHRSAAQELAVTQLGR